MARTVTVTQHGREGQVTYRDGLRTIVGYQEFGGADVVAIVSMGSPNDWRARHAWAVDQRATILRFIADELIRQWAPSCAAEIDEARGDILLRGSAAVATGAAATTPAADAAWVRRHGELKARLAVIALIVALFFAAVMWVAMRLGGRR